MYTLELLVPLLQKWLILVLLQSFFHAQLLVVAHQREQPIAPGRLLQCFGVSLQLYRVRGRLLAPISGVRPGPSWPDLLVLLGAVLLYLRPQPLLHPLARHHLLCCRQCLFGCDKRLLPAILPSCQVGFGRLHALVAVVPVVLLFLRAAVPQDTVAFCAALRAFHPLIDDVWPTLPTRVLLAVHLDEPDRRLLPFLLGHMAA